MGTIPAEKIAEVRDRIDIESVIGRTVRLQKKGSSLMGKCPFHDDDSPSFSVDPVKKLFHCFGCNVGGDVFDFVKMREGVEFPEAVRALAAEAGVQLPEKPESPSERQARTERERMYRVNEIAREHFESGLSRDDRAQAYLRESRGLSDETIAKFRLGFAPEGWENLAQSLAHKNVPVDLTLRVGLLGKKSSGRGVYDRLRRKVIFPIAIPGGRVAGFGARRADWLVENEEDRGPKYLNSIDSPIYDKSGIFYGLDIARDPIRKGGRAILVEGYFDVIALHQAGIDTAIACCGTALSARHAKMLTRLCREVVTLYDGDAAGMTATRRASESLLNNGFHVRVLHLPDGDDPDTFVRREGTGTLQELVENSPSAIDFFLKKAMQSHAGAGVAGLVNTVKEIRPLLLAVRDRDDRGIYVQGVARRLRIDARELWARLRGSEPVREDTPQPPPVFDDAPPSLAETKFVAQLCANPGPYLDELRKRGALAKFEHPVVRAIVYAADRAEQTGQPFSVTEAIEAAKASGSAGERTLADIRRNLLRAPPEPDPPAKLVKHVAENFEKKRTSDLVRKIAQESDPVLRARYEEEYVQLLEATVRTGREANYAD